MDAFEVGKKLYLFFRCLDVTIGFRLGDIARHIASDLMDGAGHADLQVRINRGPPNPAVERAQVRPKTRQIDEAVDRTQQMDRWDVTLDAEPVNSASCPTVRSPIICTTS